MSIPVVDLQEFRLSDSARKNQFVKDLGKAYEEVGFVAVSNHGIPAELIADLYKQVQTFFALPTDVKRKYEIVNLAGQRGYTSFGKEHAKGSVLPDLKEFFQFGQLVEDRDIEEQRKLQAYLDTNKTKYSVLKNGMYYIQLKQGKGTCACTGDVLKINYKGYFLDGRQFESTYDRGQPLEFTFGEQGQVIKGLEKAISLMNEGEKAKFIIPSQLAYGGEGSSTGIVPPYTTVIYEIELVKLN